ncbi:MAG: hypothetical protein ABII07_02045 [Patescibacteria group bacterium]|nr:hypothetical protein [Patescibacteria group bacterium]
MLKKTDYKHIFIGNERIGFSKCYHHELDEDLAEDGAQLILNIEIKSTQIPGEEIANELFEILSNSFFQDLEKDPYTRFEESLKMMNDLILEKESELKVKFLANINVIAAVVAKDTLYISQHGDAEAYLVRKRHVSLLTDGLHDSKTTSKEVFANIANGGVASGDRLVYSTSRLYRYITKMDLAKVFSDNSVAEGLSELSNLVSIDASEMMSVCAVGIVGRLSDGPIAHLNEKKGRKMKLPFADKFAGKFSDNKIVNYLTTKLNDLRFWLNKGSSKDTVLGEWRRLGRDKVLMALILVIVVLVVGIYMVRNQGQKQKYIEDLETTLEQVSEKVNEAETKGTYDKDRAAELLTEAEALAMDVLSSGYLRGSASQYLNAIEEERDYLDNVIRVEDVSLFADLFSKRSTVSALGMVPYQESLYAYEYNGLYEIMLGEVLDPLTISDDEVVVAGGYFEDQDNMVFLTDDGNVIEYDGVIFDFMDTLDGVFHEGVSVVPYSSRIYMLDPDSNQIWKYYRQRDSYSSAEGFNVDADLSDAVSMAIDGYVWVLNSDGTIVKLMSGAKENFQIQREPLTDYSGATKIYTAFESSQLYLLDSANSRVLVFNKDANTGNLVYSTQYVFDELDEIRDIYVAQDESRMYLLTEDSVYYYSY